MTTDSDRLDLEGCKEYRKKLEILFDGGGSIDTDDLFMNLDDLIAEVESLTKERNTFKNTARVMSLRFNEAQAEVEKLREQLAEANQACGDAMAQIQALYLGGKQ